MSKKDYWYCDELDLWSDDPQTATQDEANEQGCLVALTFRKGKQIKLSEHLDRESLFGCFDENLVSDDRVCGPAGDIFPTSSIPEEKMTELTTFIKQWCDSIDFPWWEEDDDGEIITREAKPV